MAISKFLYRNLLGILFMIPVMLSGQEASLRTGVVDSVAIDSLGRLTYYVPSNYDQARAWPVIYVFAPDGRAGVAVEVFKAAAEKYGYIIAASDAVKNGSYQENYRHARSLFERTEALLKVDSMNRFTAGFSGGARLASAIAGLSKNIRGVIACGAGVSSRYLVNERGENFVFIGIGGDEGFNYSELRSSGVLLSGLKYPYELIWFDGGHEWPPQPTIEKAVRDLSVKMFSRGQQKRSEEELRAMYGDQLAYNRRLQQDGHMLWAYEDLETMRNWYGFLKVEGELKEEMRNVKRTGVYKSQRRDMNYIHEVEPLYLQEYLDFLVEDITAGDLEALGYWDQEMKHLEKSFASHKEEAYQKMAVRVRSMLQVISGQAKKELKEPDHYQNLLFTNIFLTLVDPNDHDAYLEAVRLAVAVGEYEIALYYTDKLLESGFKDIERLQNYRGITLLRIQPEFGEVLEKYGFRSRF